MTKKEAHVGVMLMCGYFRTDSKRKKPFSQIYL